MQLKLKQQQRFVTAGGLEGTQRNKALAVIFNKQPQPVPSLTYNAEESDTRIWLHTINSYGTRKLILSPDTDVYHIGIPINSQTNLEVFVQLSSFNSIELLLLDVQALNKGFTNDPDFACLPVTAIPHVIQALYVSTGCDFISFFTGIGKATFLNTLYEYCNFICANTEEKLPGILKSHSNGLLAFARLVGCAYYKKHKSAFIPTYPTPNSLYHAMEIPGSDVATQHKKFLQFLRERVWAKVKYEEEMMPSDEALARHWKRSEWVLNVWAQSTSNSITYPPLTEYGWKIENGELKIDWESDDNMATVRQTVALIRKGCGCKTGCNTTRCKCHKAGNYCFGCKCINYTNLPDQSPGPSTAAHPQPSTQSKTESDSEQDSDRESELEREVNDIMMDVFGDCDIDDDQEIE